MRCAPCQQSPQFYNCQEYKCMEELAPKMVMVEIREYLAQLIKEGKINPDMSPITRTEYIKWYDKKYRLDSASLNDDIGREEEEDVSS